MMESQVSKSDRRKSAHNIPRYTHDETRGVRTRYLQMFITYSLYPFIFRILDTFTGKRPRTGSGQNRETDTTQPLQALGYSRRGRDKRRPRNRPPTATSCVARRSSRWYTTRLHTTLHVGYLQTSACLPTDKMRTTTREKTDKRQRQRRKKYDTREQQKTDSYKNSETDGQDRPTTNQPTSQPTTKNRVLLDKTQKTPPTFTMLYYGTPPQTTGKKEALVTAGRPGRPTSLTPQARPTQYLALSASHVGSNASLFFDNPKKGA